MAPTHHARTRSRPPADISELDLPKGATIHFPGGKDKIMSFEITLKPDEGIYRWAWPQGWLGGVGALVGGIKGGGR